MNITEFISFQTMGQVWLTPTESRQHIFIPQSFAQSIQQMCEHTKETLGCLLGYQLDGATYIESITVLGKGDEVSVYFDEERILKRNAVISKHPGLISIDFHTHPKNLDSVWWSSFSQEDKTTIAKHLNLSNDYVHVLFTPTHIGTLAIKKPKVKFLPDEQCLLMKHRFWAQELNFE